MCKCMWLFCHGSAKLIFWTTRYIVMQAAMPATFSLALQALFDATTSPSASSPFFMLSCSSTSTLGLLLVGLAGPLQYSNLTLSQSTLRLLCTSCSSASTLGLLLVDLAGPLRCNNLTPSQSTLLRAPLQWYVDFGLALSWQ